MWEDVSVQLQLLHAREITNHVILTIMARSGMTFIPTSIKVAEIESL
jgi:hypothetical protein